jgi:hypothetical protein
MVIDSRSKKKNLKIKKKMAKLLAAVLLPLLTITSLTGSAECNFLFSPRSGKNQKRLRDMTSEDYLNKYGIVLK